MTEPAKSGPKRARDIRKARARRLAIRFAIWVGVPTILAIIYYGCWATPQYESVSVFAVQSSEGSAAGIETLAAILPTSTSTRDALLVREYIRSRDVLYELDEEHGLIEHYKNPEADWWSRLDEDATSEEVFDYYLDHVTVSHDSRSGTLTLMVRAYDAEHAQKFGQAIIDAAEEMVNQMSKRARLDRIAFAESQAETAKTRLAKARAELLRLQAEGADLNPAESAEALVALRTQLESDLAKAKTNLDAVRAVMRGDAPKVIAARQRVRSLERQIARQNRRLVAGGDGSIGTSIARFEPAILEKEIAQQTFETALKSLELARMEAVRQQRYLVIVAEPSLPDTARHPRRGWGIATVFVLALVLMGVASLMGAAVREHAKF